MEGTGVSRGSSCLQAVKAEILSVYGAVDRSAGRSSSIREEAPSADAKKAEGAR